jgi:hypothetical protein
MSVKKVGVFGIYSTRVAVENATDSLLILMEAQLPRSDSRKAYGKSRRGPLC